LIHCLISLPVVVFREGLLLDMPSLHASDFDAQQLGRLVEGDWLPGCFLDVMAAFTRDAVASRRVLIGSASWGSSTDPTTSTLEDLKMCRLDPATKECATKLLDLLRFALKEPDLGKDDPDLYTCERSVANCTSGNSDNRLNAAVLAMF
jgi:hypothetical protein